MTAEVIPFKPAKDRSLMEKLNLLAEFLTEHYTDKPRRIEIRDGKEDGQFVIRVNVHVDDRLFWSKTLAEFDAWIDKECIV